jgi:hypothetical protein
VVEIGAEFLDLAGEFRTDIDKRDRPNGAGHLDAVDDPALFDGRRAIVRRHERRAVGLCKD